MYIENERLLVRSNDRYSVSWLSETLETSLLEFVGAFGACHTFSLFLPRFTQGKRMTRLIVQFHQRLSCPALSTEPRHNDINVRLVNE